MSSDTSGKPTITGLVLTYNGERLLGRPSRIDEELDPAAQAGRLMRVAHETSFGRRFFDRAAACSSA